jgi:hypothetical protein
MPGSSSLTHAGGDVLGGDEHHPLLDAGLVDGRRDVVGDADELAPLLGGERAVDGVRAHDRA